MELKFVLRKDKINKNGSCPIRADISINGQRVRKTLTGVKSSEKDWKNNRIKANLKNEKYNFHDEFNNKIKEFEDKVDTIFRYIRANNVIADRDYIIEKLNDDYFGKNSLVKDFFTTYQEYIDKSKNRVVPGSIRRYKSNKKFFEDFEAFTGYKMHFDSINLEFYEKLTTYCFEERNTLNNYFGKLVTGIKAFMNWAFERDYHQNITFKKFKAPKDRIEVIYLTIDELKKLYNFKFENPKLDKVRDLYCFSSFSGLRFSDLKNLKSSNIYEDYIRFNIQKTRTIDHITPLNKFTKEILSKYKETIYEPLPKISSQKYNEYLKIVCAKADITQKVNITRFIGSKRIDEEIPKCDLITSHTAKKTFVSNSLALGINLEIIKLTTGNTDDKTFETYTHIPNQLKINEITKYWNKI
ncbi:integrase [Polaribacter sp. ALD11]|uniref:site-specific integrase n=1 Tax=Polaribacter sp. ALD11 TaxID=2058137 RepID=UPI000C3186FD|nr:site-specific integrase [Polaribacter sp. ALD11]AUC84908.1 integrase [Polaribacter sp. ALD11]